MRSRERFAREAGKEAVIKALLEMGAGIVGLGLQVLVLSNLMEAALKGLPRPALLS